MPSKSCFFSGYKAGLFLIVTTLHCVAVSAQGNTVVPQEKRDGGAKITALRDTLHPDSMLLEDIVVTAGRSTQNIWMVPQKLERISQRDIEMTPLLDATDLLKKSAAINVIQYPGILSGIGFRGFRPDYSGLNQHTLILIDGRPAGATNLGTIDLNFVDHVEVLKGPASALYGAQAMGALLIYSHLKVLAPLKASCSATMEVSIPIRPAGR